jgi:hypothetical protein
MKFKFNWKAYFLFVKIANSSWQFFGDGPHSSSIGGRSHALGSQGSLRDSEFMDRKDNKPSLLHSKMETS